MPARDTQFVGNTSTPRSTGAKIAQRRPVVVRPFNFPLTRHARLLLGVHDWAIAGWQIDAARAVLTAEVHDYDGNKDAAEAWLAVFDDCIARDMQHQLSDQKHGGPDDNRVI